MKVSMTKKREERTKGGKEKGKERSKEKQRKR